MDPLVGQEVDGFRILDELGRGGMGIVYKVENIVLKRTEALKIISPLLVRDAQFLRRFQHEAQALAQIHHTNIVTVYTMRQSTLGHYITMEYVEGRTLAEYLVSQPDLSYQRDLPLIKQLPAAFAYAHERGIIHRDIKPNNIMLTANGTVKVMDFGLAKFYQQQDVTQSQGISGTLKYMSPEQIRGRKLDQRSDLFSLGMTIYEMLAGRLPYDEHDSMFDIQRAIVEDEFPILHTLNEAVPVQLSDIVMKALEKDPDQRYNYASEMLEAIEAFEEDMPRLGEDKTSTLPFLGHQLDTSPTATTPLHRDERTTSRRSWRRTLALAVVFVSIAVSALALAPTLMDMLSGDDNSSQTLATLAATNTTSETKDLEEQTDRESTSDRATSLPKVSDLDDADTGEADVTQDLVNARQRLDASASETTTPGSVSDKTGQTGQASEEDIPQNKLLGQTPVQDESTSLDASISSNTPEIVAGGNEETDTIQPPEDTTPGTPTESEPASPKQYVTEQAPDVAEQLKRAMIADSWSGLPGPIADFYKKKLKDLPRKFNVKSADVMIDSSNLQAIGSDVTLPITVFLTIQQKGRDGTQAIPIPSLWNWSMVDDRMTLVNVQDN
jgi:serine/threonine protein kinase